MILEKGVFGKRVLLIEKGTFICPESFLIMKGTLNRAFGFFKKGTLNRRVLLIENRESNVHTVQGPLTVVI